MLGLIHFISQIISGSGPIFPAWLNLGRIMVPQEREEYEYSKKGEGEGNTIDKLGTSTKERTQGASSPSSASNYAPWLLVALTPPLDGDDILRGREVIVARLTHSLRGIISTHAAAVVAAWRRVTAAHTWRILTKTCPHSFPLCLRRAVVGPTQRNESDSFPKPKQWIHMSTAPARRIRFLLCILHC